MAEAATLVVGPSWVGDMVMAQSLFKLLNARSPGRPIDVLAPAWSLPVIERMPEVRRGVVAETTHGEIGFTKRFRIGKEVRGRYDQAIVLPRSFKAALIPFIAGIPQRTGYRGETRFGLINDMRPFDKLALDQTVKRFMALGLERGEALPRAANPALSVSEDNQRELISKLELDTAKPGIAFMPGAEYGPAKCWPLEKFTALANSLHDDGFAVWVLGSDKDTAAGNEICAHSPAVNLSGKTSLADVIDLLGLATQAVSNDSGLMHIAAAVGTHTHAIYGSSTPDFTPPLTAARDIHYLRLACSPCFKRHCPLGHLRCLRDIRATTLHKSIQHQHESGEDKPLAAGKKSGNGSD